LGGLRSAAEPVGGGGAEQLARAGWRSVGGGVERDVADLVDDQQRDATEAAELVFQSAGALRVAEPGETPAGLRHTDAGGATAAASSTEHKPSKPVHAAIALPGFVPSERRLLDGRFIVRHSCGAVVATCRPGAVRRSRRTEPDTG
jgi:hypothetical protein